MADDASIEILRQRRAASNAAGTNGIAPDAAVEALRQQRAGGAPAVMTMQGNGDDHTPNVSSGPIPSSVARFTAPDPARAAAVSDDHGPLDNLAALGTYAIDAWKESYRSTAKAAQDMVNSKPGSLEYISHELDWFGGSVMAPFAPLGKAIGEGLTSLDKRLPAPRPLPGMTEEQLRQMRITNMGIALGALGEGVVAKPAPPTAVIRSGNPRAGAQAPPVPAPKAPGPDGSFALNEEGLVLSPDGRPASFASPRDAALWAKNVGHTAENQLFEPFTVTKDGVSTIHVRERASIEDVNPGVNPVMDELKTEQAETDAKTIAALQEATTQTKTHGRDPTLVQEFLAEQGLADKTVRLSPEALTEVWATGEEPFGDLRPQVAQALALGRDVEIPADRYVAETAGKPFAEVLNNALRVREDGLSVDESKEIPKAEEPKPVEEGEVPPKEKPLLTYDATPHKEGLAAEEAAVVDEVAPEIAKAVAKAAKNQYLKSIFAEGKAIGMTEGQMNLWGKKLEAATSAATKKMFDRLVAQIKKERTPEWKASLEQRQAEVEQAMYGRRDIVAAHYLIYNQAPNGAPLTTPPVKLDRLQIESAYGKSFADRLPQQIFGKGETIHPDVFAQDMAYLWEGEYTGVRAQVFRDSGQAMLEDIIRLTDAQKAAGLVSLKDYVKRVAKGQAINAARNELGFDTTPEGIAQAAQEAFVNPKVEDLLIAELKELAKQAKLPFEPARIEAFAEAGFSSLTNKDALNAREHVRKINSHGSKAADLALKGKAEDAFRAKQHQYINYVFFKKSLAYAKEFKKDNRNIDTWRKHPTLANMNQRHLDFIHLVIDGFGKKVSRPGDELQRAESLDNLEKFIDGLNDQGGDVYYTDPTDEEILKQTVGTFREQMDMLESLAVDGRKVKAYWNGQAQEDAQMLREEVKLNVGKIKNKAPVGGVTASGRKLPGQIPGDLGRGIDAPMRTIVSIADFMDNGDPNGPFHRMLVNPSRTALSEKLRLEREFLPRVAAAYNKIPQAIRDAHNTVIAEHPFVNPNAYVRRMGDQGLVLGDEDPIGLLTGPDDMIVMQRGDIPAILLNMGNQGNLERLAAGYHMTTEALWDFVDKTATKAEWDFAQAVWDIFEELFPKIEENKRQRSGTGLHKVEAEPVETVHGTYRGGYYPVVYNPMYRSAAKVIAQANKDAAMVQFIEEQEPPDLLSRPYRMASAPTGFEQHRLGASGALLLDIEAVLGTHMKQVFTQMGYGMWVQSANRFIHDPVIMHEVEVQMGPEYKKLFEPWLQDQFLPFDPTLSQQAGWQAISRHLRRAAHATWLGFSLKTGLSQLGGNVQTATMIGTKWTAVGAREAVRVVAQGKLEEEVLNQSEIMRERQQAPTYETLDQLSRYKSIVKGSPDFADALRHGRLLEANSILVEASLHYIGVMDFYGVSLQAWLGAKAQYMAGEVGRPAADMPTREAEARRYADKVVEQTQGTGFAKDMTALERTKDENAKWIVMFNTFTGRFYNLQMAMLRDFKQGRHYDGMKKMWLMWPATALVGALVTGQLPDKKERKDLAGWLKWALIKTAVQPLMSLPVGREIGSALDQHFNNSSPTMLRGGGGYLSRAMDYADRLVKRYTSHKKPKKGEGRKVAETVETIGLFTGMPAAAGQLGKTAQGIWNMTQKPPKSVGDALSQLTEGKPEK